MSGSACTDQSLDKAIRALHNDGVIAYPTEAVFGLGCNPRNQPALQRILNIKGREHEKGFILIAAHQDQLLDFLAPVQVLWQTHFDKYWPGPVTFVVPASAAYANSTLTGFRNTLAVRVSNHPIVCELCNRAGTALVSTSANQSGKPALRTAASVDTQFGDSLDAIVRADVGSLADPTRIFDVVSGQQLR